MSFAITTVSARAIVHVSDTRLSLLSNRSVQSESLRKCLIVMGKEARFVLGWIGFAITTQGKRHSTADWLFQVLHEMNAVELSPDLVVGNLAHLATSRFQSLIGQDKRCEFVLAGWHKSEPFAGYVSNYGALLNRERKDSDRRHHIPSISEAAVASPSFQGSIQRFRNRTRRDYVVHVSGDCDATRLSPLFKGLKGLLKRQAEVGEISSACRRIAWEAGRHSPTIGKGLITVEMEHSGPIHSSHHSKDGAETLLVPDMLGLKGSWTQFTAEAYMLKGHITLKLHAKTIKRPGSSQFPTR